MSPRSRELALLAFWSGVLFVLSFSLYTRFNSFAYFYHPDEPGKVEQLLEEKWNFNHPMLLLSATKTAIEVFRTPHRTR